MSKIHGSVSEYRLDTNWTLSYELRLPAGFDRCLLEFPNTVLHVYGGSVRLRKVVEADSLNVFVATSYPFGEETAECFATLFKGDKKEHETLCFSIDKKTPITMTNQIKVEINCTISILNDIILTTNGRYAWVAFGEQSDSLLASDFVTKVLPNQHRTVIPIEIFWGKLDLYKGTELGVFELHNSWHRFKNVYSKKLISNLLKASDFPKKKLSTKSFVSPVGEIVNLGVHHG